MIKAIVGYDISPDVDANAYREWVANVRAVELLRSPYIDKLVFNEVLRPGGAIGADRSMWTTYRIEEMQFADEAAYRKHRRWIEENPNSSDNGPTGRACLRFYFVVTAFQVGR